MLHGQRERHHRSVFGCLGGATCPSLVERLKANQPAAWRQLADIYSPLVYYWCRRYGLQPADAADVFQEVFASVFRGISGFHSDPARGRFRGWLWTIARNKIQDHFRAGDDRQRAEGGTEALRRIADLPEQLRESSANPVAGEEAKALLDGALRAVQAEFEPRTWDAFWRVVVAGQDAGEVAARARHVLAMPSGWPSRGCSATTGCCWAI